MLLLPLKAFTLLPANGMHMLPSLWIINVNNTRLLPSCTTILQVHAIHKIQSHLLHLDNKENYSFCVYVWRHRQNLYNAWKYNFATIHQTAKIITLSMELHGRGGCVVYYSSTNISAMKYGSISNVGLLFGPLNTIPEIKTIEPTASIIMSY